MNAPGKIQMLEAEVDVMMLEPVESPRATALAIQQPQSPMALMLQAGQSGTSLETLERMWALQVKFDEREAEKKHNEAFAAFKAEAVRVIKNKTVTDGPLKGKKYAELFAVNNAATQALSRHGLSTYWRTTKDEKDWIEVTCYLKHVGGHVESVSMGGPPDTGGAKSALQARASTTTFLERYTLKAILGVAEQNDDDDGGNHGAAAGDEALMRGFRDAAIEGTAALRKHYEKSKPEDAWWAKNSKALKDAAKLADGGGPQ